MSNTKKLSQEKTDEEVIYLAIDHLKTGKYRLNILLNKKVIKSITIIK